MLCVKLGRMHHLWVQVLAPRRHKHYLGRQGGSLFTGDNCSPVWSWAVQETDDGLLRVTRGPRVRVPWPPTPGGL